MKSRIFKLSICCLLALGLFTGCESSLTTDDMIVKTRELVSESTSVETSILVDLVARVVTSSSSEGHKASLVSDITISSNKSPMAYHAELFSRITVDDVMSKEDQEIYVVPDDDVYLKYEYIADTEEWEMYEMPVDETLALSTKTGVGFDWNKLTEDVSLYTDSIEVNKTDCSMYSGEVDANILQSFFGNEIFSSFMYSLEMLVTDDIPFELYISKETNYPVQLVFDLSNNFIVSDMAFDSALITVSYDNWNSISEISVPKKVAIVAIEPIKNIYNSFFAWNLFLPYVNGISSSGNSHGSSTGTFQSLWSTYQFRLDDYLSALPISYEDITKLGYQIDSNKADLIVDPNACINDVAIFKVTDKLICSIYNDTTSAQPITSCKIGAIDLTSANNSNNSITLYLPGEIHLGISRDSLYAAYGDPDAVTTSFAADLCTWKGEDDNHSLIVEISPANQKVIRIHLKRIPLAES